MKQQFEKIQSDFRVRYFPKQKQKFRNFAVDEFSQMGFENINIDNKKNIVVGDIDSAKVVYTAHYDTPPFSAYITPFTRLFGGVAGQFVSAVVLIALLTAVGVMLDYFIPNMPLMSWFYIPYFVLCLTYLIPNPNNANDNTSGVLAVLEIAKRLKSQDKSDDVAFVLFNNEELGLLGSASLAKEYAKRHKKKPQFLVCNLDCVGLGTDLAIHYRSEKAQQLAQAIQQQNANRLSLNNIDSNIQSDVGANSQDQQDATDSKTTCTVAKDIAIHVKKASLLMASDNMNFVHSLFFFTQARSLCKAFYIPKLHMPYDKTVDFDLISTVCTIALEATIEQTTES